MVSTGAVQFKPNISPTVTDQSPHKIAHIITDGKTGEKVVVEPEKSINSVMLWFHLLMSIGACFGIPTTNLAKLVGYWAACLIPAILYHMLPTLLWYLNNKLVKQPPGSSDLRNVFRMLVVPLMNHIVYPLLRRFGIKLGAMSRTTLGFVLGTLGSIGCAVLQHYVYKTPPCGYNVTTCAEILPEGAFTLSRVSYSWYAIPVIVTAISEIFVNMTVYGIAYSWSPKNMKGLVASPNLLINAILTAIGLATAPAIRDP
ncbi:hypothetical protein DL767_006565 [Monosporascus sp. MG133]|nr:hypothetical protein DL767_006565 [Monosporascus sp. MG133]